MSQSESSMHSDDPNLLAALGDYMDRIDRGESVDRVQFVAEYPELADALRSHFAQVDIVERMAGPTLAEESKASEAADTSRVVELQDTITQPLEGANTPGVREIPRVMGRYRIENTLGEGAMGAVFLAEDTELKRKVALKIPKFKDDEEPEMIERFYREAQSAATLHHRNICPVFDIGEIDGVRFISMAYISGKQLSAYVDRSKPMASERAARLIRKLALALQEAHDHDIVHRDLKPANILIDDKREPVITDFGLARIDNQKGGARITQSGMIVGSPAYMSPEQLKSDADQIGPQCDIYSLGVILYELLTGDLPFAGSIAEVIGQVMSVEPRKPSEFHKGLDARLEQICLKMMAKRRDRRFQSMTEVADALTAYLKTSRAQSSATDAAKSRRDKRRVTAKVAIDVPAFCSTARQCLAAHDYAQAVDLLSQIPGSRRNEDVNNLLKQARTLQEEVDWLVADMEEAVRKNELSGLKPNLQRLLELRPGNTQARELSNKLSGRGKGVSSWFGGSSDSGGTETALSWMFQGIGRVVAVAAIAFTVTLLSVVIYLKSGKQTVKVEIDNELLADGDVTLRIDGDTYTIGGVGQTIKLKPGEYGYTVFRGDDEIIGATQYVVHKGEKNVLTISMPLKGNGRKRSPVGSATVAEEIQTIRIDPQEVLSHEFPLPDGDGWHADGLVLSPDGGIAYLTGAKRFWMCDIEDGSAPQELSAKKLSAYEMDLSPDGQILATARPGGRVELWNTNTWELNQQLLFSDNSGQAVSVKFSGDGRWLGAAMMRGLAAVWEVKTGTLLREFPVKSQNHFSLRVAFTPDSKEMFVSGQGSDTRDYYRFVPDTGQLSVQSSSTVLGHGAIALGSGGRAAVAVWKRQPFQIADTNDWTRKRTLGTAGNNQALAWSSDSRLIATSVRSENGVALFDGQSYAHARNILVEGFDVERICFSKDNQVLAAAGLLKPNGSQKAQLAIRVWRLAPEASRGSRRKTVGPVPIAPKFPFNTAQAKQHQQAWAKYLGEPVVQDNSIGMKMTLIPPGEFLMGGTASDLDRHENENPVKAELTQPYRLSAHEVTVGQFRRFVEQTSYKTFAEKSSRGAAALVNGEPTYDASRTWRTAGDQQTDKTPVTCVTWEDATAFCIWLSRVEGNTYRLTTEAQWEWACRAGTATAYMFGDEPTRLGEFEWYKENTTKVGENYAHEVGKKRPNAFGVFDMRGNVAEWCRDSFTKQLIGGRDPVYVDESNILSTRGGIWPYSAVNSRSSRRSTSGHKSCANYLGFRVVMVIDAAKLNEPSGGNKPAPSQATGQKTNGPSPIAPKFPFPPATASRHQQAWSTHLNQPIVEKNSTGMPMTLIPPGKYIMGSPADEADRSNNEDRVDVELTRPFRLSAHEVTVGQFRRFVDDSRYKTTAEKTGLGAAVWMKGEQTYDPSRNWKSPGYPQQDETPVTCVSWTDAEAFCVWLSAKEQKKYRLPTEAEWEWACRAGAATRYFYGEDPNQVFLYAWFVENTRRAGENYPHRVGTKQPNSFGMYDMHANVWEWCRDNYSIKLPGGRNPNVQTGGNDRTNRGSCWLFSAKGCRCARRTNAGYDTRGNYGGFRVAQEIDLGSRPKPEAEKR